MTTSYRRARLTWRPHDFYSQRRLPRRVLPPQITTNSKASSIELFLFIFAIAITAYIILIIAYVVVQKTRTVLVDVDHTRKDVDDDAKSSKDVSNVAKTMYIKMLKNMNHTLDKMASSRRIGEQGDKARQNLGERERSRSESEYLYYGYGSRNDEEQRTNKKTGGWLSFLQKGNGSDSREGGSQNERTNLFDNRYGFVRTFRDRSRFDGPEEERSEASDGSFPFLHRDDCDGFCGAGMIRRRTG